MLPLLSIHDLTIDFNIDHGQTAAVTRSNFTVNKGETVAIVGESGSGKSVTALSFLQLLPQQAVIKGNIFFQQGDEKVDLLQLTQEQQSNIRGNRIAMIFQEPMTSLNPVFTCGYQVMEAIRQHQKTPNGKNISKSVAKERTIALFEKVKLPDPAAIINRYPHELSGGQKQRVMIAMAMSCDPDLLIADEPTTALDVTVQKTILELIKELQIQNGMSVVFITHDLGLVADIADKVIVMYKGDIVEQGTVAEILSSPSHPYTKALLACRPGLHSKGARLPVVSDFFNDAASVIVKDIPDIASSSNNETTSPLLIIDDLSVHFTGRKKLFGKAVDTLKAVDHVSFIVNKGETVGLVGESGCGKTTLGRAILQLIKPTSGKIILDGKDISTVNAAALRKMRKDLQIVFQDPYGSLNPRITIGDAILEPLKVHGLLDSNKERKDKVIALLEKVSLQPDHFNRYPHEFSGGQRQRICIARALALDPAFLIFDESVSALDVSVQAQVLNLLNDLKKEFGFTSIFISHDLSVVRYISDRIIVMQQGKIIEEGAADQVFFAPKEAYTKQLIAAIPGSKQINLRN
jgi:peptide/nickel transport system ATP-binding protein